VTAVRPVVRFGELTVKSEQVINFHEKPQAAEGWINGGFFVMEPAFLNYIKNDQTFLEREPLETACRKKELNAFIHEGFWQCMDTKRDKDYLEKILRRKKIFE
jgi:glucose-1-phosphate cytidylyltransferase